MRLSLSLQQLVLLLVVEPVAAYVGLSFLFNCLDN